VNPLGAGYLAVFTVAGLLGALGSTTWIRADAVAIPGSVVWIGALIATTLVSSPPPRLGWLTFAWGLTGPHLPEDVRDGYGWWLIGSFLYVIVAAACMVAGRPVSDQAERMRRRQRRSSITDAIQKWRNAGLRVWRW
jgi:hypothetical protein